jgi:hypothetical protein
LDGLPRALEADTQGQIAGLDPDRQLFGGYLHTVRPGELGVDIAGLGALFERYEVYVYLDADDARSAPGRSVIRVGAGGLYRYLDDPRGSNFKGAYLESAGTTAAAATLGNFVHFSGLTDDRLRVRVRATGTEHAVRPAIAGIQIVGTPRSGGTVGSPTAQTLLSAAALGASGGIYVPAVPESLLFDPESGGLVPLPEAGSDWVLDNGSYQPAGAIAW